MSRCACGVSTPRPVCYFCARPPAPRVVPRRSLKWRAVTPAQERAIRSAVARGGSRTAIASAYGVSVRTVHRILRRTDEPTIPVEIAGYRAEFIVDEDGPRQRTSWVAA